jgi:phosphatidylserine decarboxylase
MPNLSFGERIAQNTWRFLPKRFLSRMIGWGARRGLPGPHQRSILRSCSRFFRLDAGDEAAGLLSALRSLSSFITWRLAQDVRALPSDGNLRLAPPDGRLCEAGLAVKGGQELGISNLGSRTIALFEPGRVALSNLDSDQQMRMGDPVGRIIAL